MSRFPQKMATVTLRIPERAHDTLERQAKQRGVQPSLWIGQVFDMGFAAVCAREKSMPIADGDLDAIVGAALLLREKEQWDTATIGKSLGVPETTIIRIFDGWKLYRTGAGTALSAVARADDAQAALLEEALSMEGLLELKMRKKFRLILEVLVKHPGKFVPLERLTNKLWEEDPDGGPEDADSLVYNHVSLLRRDVLNSRGWTIVSSRHEGYRLERLP